jgi:hypothetical protein
MIVRKLITAQEQRSVLPFQNHKLKWRKAIKLESYYSGKPTLISTIVGSRASFSTRTLGMGFIRMKEVLVESLPLYRVSLSSIGSLSQNRRNIKRYQYQIEMGL